MIMPVAWYCVSKEDGIAAAADAICDIEAKVEN